MGESPAKAEWEVLRWVELLVMAWVATGAVSLVVRVVVVPLLAIQGLGMPNHRIHKTLDKVLLAVWVDSRILRSRT